MRAVSWAFRAVVVACAAMLVVDGAGVTVAHAALSSPASAAQGTVYSATMTDGGVACTIEFQYGNVWATSYAKVRMKTSGCTVVGITLDQYGAGGFTTTYVQSPTNPPTPTGWYTATGPTYTSVTHVLFVMHNDAGFDYCLGYNAITQQRDNTLC